MPLPRLERQVALDPGRAPSVLRTSTAATEARLRSSASLGKIGDTIQAWGERRLDEEDTTAAIEATNNMLIEVNNAMTSDIEQRKGADARGSAAAAGQLWNDSVEKFSQGMSPRARRRFMVRANRSQISILNQAALHERRQTESHYQNQAQITQALAAHNGTLAAINGDARGYTEQREVAVQAARDLAARTNQDQAATRALILTASDQYTEATLRGLAVEDPVTAMAMIDSLRRLNAELVEEGRDPVALEGTLAQLEKQAEGAARDQVAQNWVYQHLGESEDDYSAVKEMARKQFQHDEEQLSKTLSLIDSIQISRNRDMRAVQAKNSTQFVGEMIGILNASDVTEEQKQVGAREVLAKATALAAGDPDAVSATTLRSLNTLLKAADPSRVETDISSYAEVMGIYAEAERTQDFSKFNELDLTSYAGLLSTTDLKTFIRLQASSQKPGVNPLTGVVTEARRRLESQGLKKPTSSASKRKHRQYNSMQTAYTFEAMRLREQLASEKSNPDYRLTPADYEAVDRIAFSQFPEEIGFMHNVFGLDRDNDETLADVDPDDLAIARQALVNGAGQGLVFEGKTIAIDDMSQIDMYLYLRDQRTSDGGQSLLERERQRRSEGAE